MKQLARFEANLLRIVHGVLQRAPVEKVLPLVTMKLAQPPCLSRPAVELLQDTLAKGTVALLAREGWRHQRFLRGPQVANGRLWQRTPPQDLGLAFSEHSLRFLIWLTAWDGKDKDFPKSPPADRLAAGDRLLFLLAYRLLRDTDVAASLRKCGHIASNEMCRLIFPDDFAGLPQPAAPDWSFWTTGVGSCILECFQISLSRRWTEMEIDKRHIGSVARMLEVGQSQEQILRGFLEAAGKAGRRDLARFLLIAYGAVLADSPTAQRWIAGLQVGELRLAQRVEAHRAALAFLRQLKHLQQWDAQERMVGYFDEGYAASQLWKSDWEKHRGDELCRRADLILREVEPLKGDNP